MVENRDRDSLKPGSNLDGRVMVNLRNCDWQPSPDRGSLAWHPVRVVSRPGIGFHLLDSAPGESAPRLGSGVREEFTILDGSLIDSDGLK